MLKFHLLRAQNRMKQYADAHRSPREFQIGDFVYLKLQPYRQNTLKNRKVPHKLSPRFYGPFRVTDRVGTIAYKLSLPPEAAIHDTFHVSPLKLCPTPLTADPEIPQYWLDLGNSKEPEAISGKENHLKLPLGSSTKTLPPSTLFLILEDKVDLKEGVLS